MACAWAERAIASTSARAGEIAFVQHHMDSLVAVDDLRDPQVGGEACEGIGLVAVESGARADEIEHLTRAIGKRASNKTGFLRRAAAFDWETESWQNVVEFLEKTADIFRHSHPGNRIDDVLLSGSISRGANGGMALRVSILPGAMALSRR